MFENLRADIDRLRQEDVEQGWWKRNGWTQTIRYLVTIGMAPVVVYRFERWIHTRVHIPIVRQALQVFGVLLRRFSGMYTGVLISPRAEIGPGLEIHTFYGVFIGITTIGKNFTVGTGVLVSCGVRSIGDNVYMGAGAKIVGDVKIGNNVVIMPNSLVITDVADNTTIAGVPARIKLRGGRPKQFYPVVGKNAKTPAEKQALATPPTVAAFAPATPKTGSLGASDSQTETVEEVQPSLNGRQ
jgi:serine O-acetyltransferase